MHELALCRNILDLVVECARSERVEKITRITIEVGGAAGVEPDTLRLCFDIVTADTVAQGAELAIETVALQARHRGCACQFAPRRAFSACPHCGAGAPVLLNGRELRVKSFDCQ